MNTNTYLVELRGLSIAARAHHAHVVSDFLVRGVGPRAQSVLTQRDVEGFIVLRSREISRQSMQHVIGILRSLLRFCYDRGDELTARSNDRYADTTMRYARADLDLKRQAPSRVFRTRSRHRAADIFRSMAGISSAGCDACNRGNRK